MSLSRGSWIKSRLSRSPLGEQSSVNRSSEKSALMGSKLVSQMEEVLQASAALQPEVTGAMIDLSNSVSSAVDLAIQVSPIPQPTRCSADDYSWHSE
jgi:hypothetical protein